MSEDAGSGMPAAERDGVVFTNQAAASQYVRAVADVRRRVYLEFALSGCIGFVLRARDDRSRPMTLPFDLLTFIRALDVIGGRRDVLDAIQTGRYSSFEEVAEALGLF
jgi:hypothetical protein